MQRACQPTAVPARPLAPLWHLRVLLCVLLLAPIAALSSDGAFEPAPRPEAQIGALYAPLLLANAAFALYVARVGLGANKLGLLFGRPSMLDLPLGLGLAAALLAVDGALQALGTSAESLAGHALLPRSATATLWWLPVAIGTALSEELVYRGYLRRQLAAHSGSVALSVVMQAALFGIAHGPQGPSAVLRYSLYGLILGAVAQRRRGLLAVVVCHAAVNLYAGLGG